MELHNFNELMQAVGGGARQRTAAVVCAHDPVTFQAALHCARNGWVRPILIGDGKALRAMMEESGASLGEMELIDQSDPEQAAKAGVQLVRQGGADFLMKGKLDTSVILKAVVSRDCGLGAGSLMSHLAFLEIPTYHKLVVLTDSGMVIRPDFSQKIEILKNAARTLCSMGYEQPKIGLLAAVEKENSQMPETVDAAALTALNRRGTISGCCVEGPVSYDILMSREIAEKKGFSSPVVGNADVLMVGDMATGNILGKALTVSAGAGMAGMIVGARVPIALTSRGAHMEEKINSMLLAAACCRDREESY